MSNSNRSALESTGQQPRVLETSPLLTTRELTNKLVKMVESGKIMTEPIYVNDDVRRNPPPPPRPRVLKTSPLLTTRKLTNKLVKMVESGKIMTEPIYVNDDVRRKKGGKYSKNVYKKVGKKEVLGKDRVIYKMKGSNKEYLKTKGMYIPVSEYKKLKK
jgi:hypothetical protein